MQPIFTNPCMRNRVTVLTVEEYESRNKYHNYVNVLSLTQQGKLRNSSSTWYLISLAILDQIVIVTAVLGSHMIRSFR